MSDKKNSMLSEDRRANGAVAECQPHSAVRLPFWLKRKLAFSGRHSEVTLALSSCNLNTVCALAKCPNRGECFSRGGAAFLILGSICTRNCAFCGVGFGRPQEVDANEGLRLAIAAQKIGLKHVVITSVTRDDLPDGGASVFADTLKHLRDKIPKATTETLIPDFQGSKESLYTVIDAGPNILNHNMETVSRLYPLIRPQAIYDRSLQLLRRAAADGRAVVKSGIMVGLGETDSEVVGLMGDIRASGCTIITVGQYLRPSADKLPVKEFIHPEQFEYYNETAINMGFKQAFCGPYIRSSYRAEECVTN